MDMYKEAMKLQTYPHFLVCPGGETVEQVTQRASDFFKVIFHHSSLCSSYK